VAASPASKAAPKSTLHQGFWEDSSSAVALTLTLTPADRVRALASAEWPDWTWSGDEWITVCGFTTDSNGTTATLPEKLDGETMEAAGGSNDDDERVPSSSGAADDASCTSCLCNSVVTDDDWNTKLASPGNGRHWPVNFRVPPSRPVVTARLTEYGFLSFQREPTVNLCTYTSPLRFTKEITIEKYASLVNAGCL
jgi:hypothetical protein